MRTAQLLHATVARLTNNKLSQLSAECVVALISVICYRHYHEQINDYIWDEIVTDSGAGYDRKFESTLRKPKWRLWFTSPQCQTDR